jgi:hypothetical protein
VITIKGARYRLPIKLFKLKRVVVITTKGSNSERASEGRIKLLLG